MIDRSNNLAHQITTKDLVLDVALLMRAQDEGALVRCFDWH
jgi:hypothetical protein